MQFFSEKKIYDFMKMRYGSLVVCAILVLGTIFLFFERGLAFGIDFSGGTLVQVRYEGKAPIPQIREILGKTGEFQNLSVTEFGADNEITIRFLGSSSSLSADIGQHISELLQGTGLSLIHI